MTPLRLSPSQYNHCVKPDRTMLNNRRMAYFCFKCRQHETVKGAYLAWLNCGVGTITCQPEQEVALLACCGDCWQQAHGLLNLGLGMKKNEQTLDSWRPQEQTHDQPSMFPTPSGIVRNSRSRAREAQHPKFLSDLLGRQQVSPWKPACSCFGSKPLQPPSPGCPSQLLRTLPSGVRPRPSAPCIASFACDIK